MLPEVSHDGAGESLTLPLAQPTNGCCRGTIVTTIPKEAMRDFMAITRALADETRVRVLLALQRGELCVCQIVDLMGLATSTISKHMSILKQARLVESRKDGRWMYYRLADDDAPAAVRLALTWVSDSLEADSQVVRDKQALARICTSDPKQSCASRVVAKPSAKAS